MTDKKNDKRPDIIDFPGKPQPERINVTAANFAEAISAEYEEAKAALMNAQAVLFQLKEQEDALQLEAGQCAARLDALDKANRRAATAAQNEHKAKSETAKV